MLLQKQSINAEWLYMCDDLSIRTIENPIATATSSQNLEDRPNSTESSNIDAGAPAQHKIDPGHRSISIKMHEYCYGLPWSTWHCAPRCYVQCFAIWLSCN